ncbi:MAG TPA: hypothetical protein VK071_06350 [Tissierellales bacterium]|nr:hypothetical protein [Tissierellales bacterium]
MNNSILYENIYSALLRLAEKNSLRRVNNIKILVNKNIDISEKDLLKYLKIENNILFGEWTSIDIEKDEIEIIKAVIKVVD